MDQRVDMTGWWSYTNRAHEILMYKRNAGASITRRHTRRGSPWRKRWHHSPPPVWMHCAGRMTRLLYWCVKDGSNTAPTIIWPPVARPLPLHFFCHNYHFFLGQNRGGDGYKETNIKFAFRGGEAFRAIFRTQRHATCVNGCHWSWNAYVWCQPVHPLWMNWTSHFPNTPHNLTPSGEAISLTFWSFSTTTIL